MSVLVFSLLLASCSALLGPMTNGNGEYDIASVANHVLLLEQMTAALNTKVSSQATEIAAANSELSTVKTKYQALESNYQKLQTTLENERMLREVKDQNLTAAIALLNTEVKYEVLLDQDINDQKDNEVLKFDTVKYNAGGAYHNTSGVFVAPASGSYLFWCNVMNEDDTSLYISLFHEGSIVGKGYTPQEYFFASITTVVYVNKGDNVWFESHGASKLNGGFFSNFGGALLHIY